jgi:hypothetical protein
LEKIIRQLNATIIATGKDEISLTELTMAMFLNSLPNRFNSVRSLLEASDETLKVNSVRKKIQEEEQRQNLRRDTSSMNNFAGIVKKGQK